MAVVTRVRRLVANPQRRTRKRKRKNPKHRRRMTAKQIKFFGTKRQRAALKARRRKTRSAPKRRRVVHRSRGLKVTVNPRRKVRARRRNAPAKRRRKSNPALIVTLGAVNPRGGSSMAAGRKRKKKAHRANPRRRRRNATRVVVTAPRRRRNPTRRRRNRVDHRRRRNPEMFGLSGGNMAKAVVAGLGGVAAAKFLPTLIPSQYVSGNLMRTVATGASAFVAQMIVKAITKDRTVTDAVLFGGLMQTGSTALNAFLPGLAAQLGLSGLGTFEDAHWTIPENPLKALPVAAAAPAAGDARMGVAGLARAYGSAY